MAVPFNCDAINNASSWSVSPRSCLVRSADSSGTCAVSSYPHCSVLQGEHSQTPFGRFQPVQACVSANPRRIRFNFFCEIVILVISRWCLFGGRRGRVVIIASASAPLNIRISDTDVHRTQSSKVWQNSSNTPESIHKGACDRECLYRAPITCNCTPSSQKRGQSGRRSLRQQLTRHTHTAMDTCACTLVKHSQR